MDRFRRVCFSPPFLALASIIAIFCGLKYYAPQYLVHHSEEIENQVWALKQQIDSLQRDIGRLHREMGSNLVIERPNNSFPETMPRSEGSRKRILVTGGTGFVGSHLVDKLMKEGHEVIALDNYFTGRKKNVEQWIGHPNFELVHHDVVNPYYVEVDQIYHLASPASPPHYMYNPVKTLKTNTIGTVNMLGLARRVKARMLLASTSEIYGDPEVHPQPETYWGHVNTIGPRACYDEGKRVAESLMVAYQKQEKVDIRIARIFNTFGPRMHMNDGRVVSNFILQALQNQPITIYGEGAQTRSFQYVDDLVDGLIALMNSNTTLPVNIGNPEEYTIKDFAVVIRDIIGSKSEIINHPKVEDDPQQRRPDIRRAAELLNWKPKVSMRDGLKKTIEYFQKELNSSIIYQRTEVSCTVVMKRSHLTSTKKLPPPQKIANDDWDDDIEDEIVYAKSQVSASQRIASQVVSQRQTPQRSIQPSFSTSSTSISTPQTSAQFPSFKAPLPKIPRIAGPQANNIRIPNPQFQPRAAIPAAPPTSSTTFFQRQSVPQPRLQRFPAPNLNLPAPTTTSTKPATTNSSVPKKVPTASNGIQRLPSSNLPGPKKIKTTSTGVQTTGNYQNQKLGPIKYQHLNGQFNLMWQMRNDRKKSAMQFQGVFPKFNTFYTLKDS